AKVAIRLLGRDGHRVRVRGSRFALPAGGSSYRIELAITGEDGKRKTKRHTVLVL
ncbi:MAG: hypothetical protein H0V29_06530, partial [Thermoleophilaceae bacterium]|nr:hypothetical protein [Thermoleophilaceae bacterium]